MPKIFLIFSILFLSSCGLFGDKLTLNKKDFSEIAGWESDDQSGALEAFLKSCRKFNVLPVAKPVHESGVGGVYGDWRDVCARAKMSRMAPRRFFEENFTPYLASNWGDEKGVFTGYFEAEIEGSRTRHGEYQYPIYKRPAGLKDGKKYYSRKQIESGVLKGKGLEMAWVKDPVKAFFMHVQGSGRIKMDDGSVMRVGYNGKNGYKYVSIGRYMIDKGYIKEEEISAQAIKKWLAENPGDVMDILQQNPSYVFFRQIGDEGPIGGQGVPLTPMRSLAVDKKFVPYGAPVWVDVQLNGAKDNKNLQQLLVAQDTGSAIRGPVRGDLFFGYGREAEEMAGYQNSEGKYFILLPR